jgi:hypothetical protein
MDQTDPALDLDPLRHLVEAALARQKAAQRQQSDDQAPGRPRPDSQGRGADHTLTLAEAQQLAEHLTWTVRHRAGQLPSHLRHTLRDVASARRPAARSSTS